LETTAGVLPSPLDNFGLELCFLTLKLSPKTRGHVLMTKIDRITTPSARPVRPVNQTDQIGPLD
jgi:hypothetical protein